MNMRKDRRAISRTLGCVGVAARLVVLAPLVVFPSAVMPQEAATTQLPYGLSCSQCMIDERSTCAALSKAELVIDARRMEPIDERRECAADAKTCHVTAGSRFGGVFVLRSPRPTVSTKIFLSNYTVDDASPEHVEGVRLLPDTRYILFMKRATWNAPFKAEWQVLGACVAPSKPIMAGPSE